MLEASRERISFIEVNLIFLGMAMFSICSYWYITDYPIGKFLFGPDFVVQLDPVGKVRHEAGGTRRKINTQSEFKTVVTSDTLYNFDTIVTGPEGEAIIEFNDGSTIELAAKTMIKLVFEENIGLSGISRATKVNILSGKVKGKAKNRNIILKTKEKQINLAETSERTLELASVPKLELKAPPKEQVIIPLAEILTPRSGDRLRVEDGALVASKSVALDWKVTPVNTPVEVVLKKVTKDGKSRKILSKQYKKKEGMGTVRANIKRPGVYEWEILPVGEARFQTEARTRFKVEEDFRAIQTLAPLVSGKKLKTSRLQSDKTLNQFDLRLRWRQYPKAKEYLVSFYRSATSRKPILQRKAKKNQIVLNRDKVFAGKLYYEVASVLPSGFVAKSRREPFRFDFLPPILVEPKNNSSLTKEEIQKDGDQLVFTWERTNFTDRYQLELSNVETFRGKVIRKSTSENYMIIRALPDGRYFWRVRSIAKDVVSPPSRIHSLTINP